MIIASLKPFTLIDYSGKIACTVFTNGCNFRCPYCHNPNLVLEKPETEISWDEILYFLKQRQGFLNGVCITGGEPTIHRELPAFLAKIRDEGASVKLDTNGSNPRMLQRLIKEKLVNYVAMDIKAPLNEYEKIARVAVDKGDIQKSVDILRKGVVDFEFRITVVPGLIEEGALREIGKWLKGAPKFFLQQFRPDNTLDETFVEVEPFPEDMFHRFCALLRPYFDHCATRGLERILPE